MILSQAHRRELEQSSAIDPSVIEERGSVRKQKDNQHVQTSDKLSDSRTMSLRFPCAPYLLPSLKIVQTPIEAASFGPR
jgi:hypothetical protein